MSTIQDVRAAEQRMNKVKAALQRYLDRPSNEQGDHALHLRLAEELREATDEYVKHVADLKP